MPETEGASAVDSGHPAGTGVLLAACVSSLVVNANTSAVTILLPAISEDLNAPIDQLQWAVTGYMLVGQLSSSPPGALGDVFGRRKIFLAGLVLFVASCVLIALSSSGAGVVAGRMIQGAAGSTLLACGMSLLSVASSGAAGMRAITLWGAASAAGAAIGPLIGGLLVEITGWQGLFWIDAAIAAACIPLTLATVKESRDAEPATVDRLRRDRADRRRAGSARAGVEQGVRLGLDLGLDSGVPGGVGGRCHRLCRRRTASRGAPGRPATLPQPDPGGSTLAILLVAGAINALMYLMSLYFQDPVAFAMTPLQAGLATLPAAAAMIAVTPLITPLAVKIGARYAVAVGFALAAAGMCVLVFVGPSWAYVAFVVPLAATAIGLGLANGPASSASTATVSADQIGQASGISNMARYVGGSMAVAAAGSVYSAVNAAQLAGRGRGRRTGHRSVSCGTPRHHHGDRGHRPRSPDGTLPSAQSARSPPGRGAAAARPHHPGALPRPCDVLTAQPHR